VLLVVFGCSGWRALRAADDARARWIEAAAATAPPVRCALVGRVLASPTVRDGAASAVVRIERSTCEAGRALPPGAVARLREVPVALGRGDRLIAVSRVAAPYLFRNHGGGVAWARVARTS